ncbi:penicillin-binding protein 1B [Luteimonas sp. FXH3W]|uniref:Penicillin-binding protein 1B n=1 Tax=Aquilutibacter rugosus TaxID=3115820 RepID=A0ABU7UXM5_9GAMM
MQPIDRDPDYDDVAPDADDEWADYDEGPSWLSRLLRIGVTVTALGLGFLLPYVLYLNGQVTERFGKLQWQVPTRVFARPLLVAPGIPLDDASLKTELNAASYYPGDGLRPGTYLQEGSRWVISSRGYNDVDGRILPKKVELTLSEGKVVDLRDASARTELRAARLDPARIATLYGKMQEERRLVRIDEVPELLVTGLQAVEDRDFNHHIGIDFGGLARAVFKNMVAGEIVGGGSTLTQQLARSGLLGIGKEQTYSRKFKEILYALLLEARYDKRTILEAYFNQVFLGQRGNNPIMGVASGAEFWFGKDLKDLEPHQIALLIGMVKGPSYYDPRKHPERALERRNFVLGEMRETQLITEAQYNRATQAPLDVSKTPGQSFANRFPAYVDLVRRQLARDYDENAISGQGLSVMSGMSPSAQAYTESAVAATLKSLQTKGRPSLETGTVVTDVQTGDVLAVVGAHDYNVAGYNRAVQAQRPVGSLLKPFVYLLALGEPSKYNLGTWLNDDPVRVDLGNGQVWQPKNSDGRSHGSVRMIDALANSYNQSTVRVGMDIGVARLNKLMLALAGIQGTSNPSVILGATEQSPYAMAQLYQFLASHGKVQSLHAVRGVLDARGMAISRYDTKAAAPPLGDSTAAELVTYALQEAVRSGTARQLQADGLGRLNAAGKTGTSNDSRDSWYAGWTGSHLAVSWVGNDRNQQTGLYGATGGMRVWSNLFKRLPTLPLGLTNQGIEYAAVIGADTVPADCPGARRLPFVTGYTPPMIACPNVPAVSDPVSSTVDEVRDRVGEFMNSIFGGGDSGSEPPSPPPANASEPAQGPQPK